MASRVRAQHPFVDAEQFSRLKGMELPFQFQTGGALGENQFHFPVPVEGDDRVGKVVGGQGCPKQVPFRVLLVLIPQHGKTTFRSYCGKKRA